MCPDIDNLVVTLGVGDETHRVVGKHLFNLSITVVNELFLFGRNNDVAKVERKTTLECHLVSEVLDIVEELSRAGNTTGLDNAADDYTQRLLRNDFVNVANLVRNKLVNKNTAHRGVFYHLVNEVAVFVKVLHNYRNWRMERYLAFVVGNFGFFFSMNKLSNFKC